MLQFETKYHKEINVGCLLVAAVLGVLANAGFVPDSAVSMFNSAAIALGFMGGASFVKPVAP